MDCVARLDFPSVIAGYAQSVAVSLSNGCTLSPLVFDYVLLPLLGAVRALLICVRSPLHQVMRSGFLASFLLSGRWLVVGA